jgi:hypothetical protein
MYGFLENQIDALTSQIEREQTDCDVNKGLLCLLIIRSYDTRQSQTK